MCPFARCHLLICARRYRDIKCLNVFLTSAGEVKLGDFGHCRRLDADGFAHTTCGTPETMSPEMVLGCPYDVKADTWAVGCVLYELMMLRRPFDGLTVHELLAKVCRAAYDPPPEDMNNDIRLLISVMLTADPRNRPTMSELQAFPAVKKAKEAHRKSQMAPRQRTLTDVMAKIQDLLWDCKNNNARIAANICKFYDRR